MIGSIILGIITIVFVLISLTFHFKNIRNFNISMILFCVFFVLFILSIFILPEATEDRLITEETYNKEIVVLNNSIIETNSDSVRFYVKNDNNEIEQVKLPITLNTHIMYGSENRVIIEKHKFKYFIDNFIKQLPSDTITIYVKTNE